MSEKAKQILSYILGWIMGVIVLFAIKDNTKKTNFHAAQAIVLTAGYQIVLGIYNALPIYIPFLSTVLYVFYIILIIMGIAKANNNEHPELPVVGDLARKIFEKQINQGRDDEVASQTQQSNATAETQVTQAESEIQNVDQTPTESIGENIEQTQTDNSNNDESSIPPNFN